MKKFSRKLVSRCVYCNILLSTSCDVLEEFLKSGGWETIHLWIKSAKELENRPFLDELLKLLLILPMNVERLRENDSPKIIKSISKREDQVLAAKAKQIVEKWTKMIEMASDSKGVKDGKDVNHKKEHKKRKKDIIESNSDPKKAKTLTKVDSIDLNSTDSNVSIDSIKLKLKLDRTVRPTTAKVKPGKSRLDGLVSSQANAKSIKSRKESPIIGSKKLSPNSNNKSLNTNNTEIIGNPVISASVSKVKPQPIETKSSVVASIGSPTHSVSTTPPPTTAPAIKYVLHESTSFMDALMDTPMSHSDRKKKRRLSASVGGKEGKDSGSSGNSCEPLEPTSSPKASSPPKAFSFYKDMIDERVDQRNSDSNTNFSDDNEDNDSNNSETNKSDEQIGDNNQEEINHINVDITVPDISIVTSASLPAPPTVISVKSSSNKIKPILCYVKKGVKKSVRWVDENDAKRSIQTVKFFDLDETERVNVTRPAGAAVQSFGDIRRFDMRHEAELMLMARRSASAFDVSDDYQSRTESFSPWRLIPCDGDTNCTEIGKDSKERHIQAERMRTILETFYTRNQIPDSAQEPDPEVYLDSGSDSFKVIPLDDETNPNNYHDFSQIDLPKPKTGEQLPPRVPDFSPGQPPINNFSPMPSNQFSAAGAPHLLPGAPPFAGQPMLPPFPGPSLLPAPEPFGVRMPTPPHQQFFPPNNGPPFPQWGDGGPGGPPPRQGPPPPHFVPPFGDHGRGGGPRPRLPRNAQNTVCRHYARTGKCRFQPKCNFLHSNDR